MLMDYESLFKKHQEKSISGRYLTLEHIQPVLDALATNPHISIEERGKSVQERPIHVLKMGSGAIRIFVWSQMHGNESTTTKAIMDWIHYLVSNEAIAASFRNRYTFCIVPMLNPDGAFMHTRENAQEVDLNRDFVHLSQPESRLLMQLFEEFKPDYCFNMHDQRSIFGVGTPLKPATISFLAPAFDETLAMNPVRLKAVGVISAMYQVLSAFIPGQIGRFDDAFNRNCVGDTFQSLGVPTILIEAGHFPEDYEREQTRFYVFVSLISALHKIYENDIVSNDLTVYLEIPQNNPLFFDFVYRNVKICYDNSILITNFAAHFVEEIKDNRFQRIAKIVAIGGLHTHSGHVEFDAQGQFFKSDVSDFPIMNQMADFYIGDDMKFVNGVIKK
jgi:hypothetical protein